MAAKLRAESRKKTLRALYFQQPFRSDRGYVTLQSVKLAPNAWILAIESSFGCSRKLIGCNMHCHGPVVLVLPGTGYHCEQSSFRWFPPSVKENPCHPLSVSVLFQRWVMTRCVCGRLMFFQLTRCPVLLGHETFGGLCRIWEG